MVVTLFGLLRERAGASAGPAASQDAGREHRMTGGDERHPRSEARALK